MKIKKIIFSALTIFSLIACKENHKNDEVEISEPKLTATLELVIQQDDSIQLFYRDEAIPAYAEETSLWMPVKGSKSEQEITFTIPEEIVPTHLRFDLGKNKTQSPIRINNFRLNYHDKTYESGDSTMTFYFLANDHLKYDATTGTFNPLNVDGQSYDPFIYSTDLLSKQVSKLVR